MNDRDVFMDVQLAEAAVIAIEMEQKVLAKPTWELTDNKVQIATQRDAMLKHIARAVTIELPDMQASALQRRIHDPDLPFELRELLAIILQVSATRTSNYPDRDDPEACGGSLTTRITVSPSSSELGTTHGSPNEWLI